MRMPTFIPEIIYVRIDGWAGGQTRTECSHDIASMERVEEGFSMNCGDNIITNHKISHLDIENYMI